METHDSLKFFAPKVIRLLFFCGKRGIILFGSILNKLGLCFLHPQSISSIQITRTGMESCTQHSHKMKANKQQAENPFFKVTV